MAQTSGRLSMLLWPDRVLLACTDAQPTLHRHHPLQLSLALDAALWVRLEGRPAVPLRNALIGSGVAHCISGRNAQLYFEPESFGGRILRAALRGRPWAELDDAALDACRRALAPEAIKAPEQALAASSNLLADLGRGQPLPPPPEDRIWELLAQLRGNPARRAPLEELAESARLSPSRLRHLFREQIGLPIRSYAVWLRTRTALGELVTNSPLSLTAHAAGFADHAALSRTHRSTWGVQPSRFLRQTRFPQPLSERRANVHAWRLPSSLPLHD